MTPESERAIRLAVENSEADLSVEIGRLLMDALDAERAAHARAVVWIAGLRSALEKIGSCSDGKSMSWPEIDALIRTTLAASPSDWETQARQVVEALRKLSHASQVGVPDHKKRECLYASGYDALATPFARLLGGGK